jgi:hypothetical protein
MQDKASSAKWTIPSGKQLCFYKDVGCPESAGDPPFCVTSQTPPSWALRGHNIADSITSFSFKNIASN